jgi:hypothetical protein
MGWVDELLGLRQADRELFRPLQVAAPPAEVAMIRLDAPDNANARERATYLLCARSAPMECAEWSEWTK